MVDRIPPATGRAALFTVDFLTLGRSASVFDVSTNLLRAPVTAIVNGTVMHDDPHGDPPAR